MEHKLNKLKDKKFLPPPWIAYPEIERYSIGWRMGYGEGYIGEWGTWYDTLDSKEKNEYHTLFPEPVTWNGYWEDEDNGIYYIKDEYYLQFWREKGAYKYSVESIRGMHNAGKKLDYNMFWGHQPSADGSMNQSCLSQWWMEDFQYENDIYCCMEQFMMAQKAEVFDDAEIREEIMNCREPKEIKALGRKVRGFDESVWNKVKYSIVLNGNFRKFTQNPKLREFLLSIGENILVEASTYDAIWGIRMSANNENAQNPMKWQGQNLLGFALMEVRDEIRRVWENAELCEKVE